ncbi:siderophore biosynthesis regulatory protein URBS1 [Hyalella azteca]|uniref:Siderophore biosynthesis regulatory protein URBS1 n=1 Tax=Hyalella azteca TaxID=294128 RepID=A0A8B7N207_HYAAZ|nr:siderophore biosynthesis regulatory protein URBS1 [Hyalella azteca]
MSCAQVMYQPYAGSPYTAPPTPHTTPTSSNGADPHTQPHQPPAPTQVQQQQASLPDVSAPNNAVSTPISAAAATTNSNTPTPTQALQQHASDTPREAAQGRCSSRAAPYRATSNGSATGDADQPPEKKLCSERQTPVTPATPSHPYHPLHHHHHHHHLLNQHHLPSHQHHQHHHNLITNADVTDANANAAANDVRYVSANCVVVTHYRGDTAAMVDEHFSRALAPTHCEKPHHNKGATSPMSARNFPASFWNSNYTRAGAGLGHLGVHGHPDLYDPYHPGLHSLQNSGHHDPWTTYSLSSQAYSHRSMAHDMYQAAMSSCSPRPYQQYGIGLQPSLARIPALPAVPAQVSRPAMYQQYGIGLQPSLARIPALPAVPAQMSMSKPDGWGRYHDAFSGDLAAHGLDAGYSAHYPAVATGLESAVQQEGPKDLYWF